MAEPVEYSSPPKRPLLPAWFWVLLCVWMALFVLGGWDNFRTMPLPFESRPKPIKVSPRLASATRP